MRLLNGIHVMFISIPQILIITINSSIHGMFQKLSILSLVISIAFIVLSSLYYFLCVIKEVDYDDYITNTVYHDE